MNRFRVLRVPGAIVLGVAIVAACSPSPTPATPIVSVAPGAIVIEAKALKFSPQEVRATAGSSFQLILHNRDTSVPHNIEVRRAGKVVFKGETINGPTDIAYEVGPLEAGSYEFLCTVHPTMTGTIEVD